MRELAVRAAALGNTLAVLVARDADAYAAVAAAYKLPADTPELEAAKTRTVDETLLAAAAVPLETAAACAGVAELALAVAERGNTNAASDAGIAALLAEAGCVGASYNVRINVGALSDRSLGARLAEDAQRLVVRTRELARRTAEAVERVLDA
jgi:glutamate formiminotransferase/formiminotetrahydrofolate cyclodeaminase